MVIRYYFDESDWDYEIDDETAKELFLQFYFNEYEYHSISSNKPLSNEESLKIKDYIRWFADNFLDSEDIERYLENYEDEIKDIYESSAYSELQDNIQAEKDDIDDYNHMRYNNCRL